LPRSGTLRDKAHRNEGEATLLPGRQTG